MKQYNVVVDPQKLRDLGIPLDRIREVIRASNTDVGGRTLELSEFDTGCTQSKLAVYRPR